MLLNNGTNVGIGGASFSEKLDVTGNVRASTGFLANDGSAGTPSYRFTNSPTTGIYRQGADAIGVSTAGTERMRIGADGNVGIGVSANALERLQVGGDMLFSRGADRSITVQNALSLTNANDLTVSAGNSLNDAQFSTGGDLLLSAGTGNVSLSKGGGDLILRSGANFKNNAGGDIVLETGTNNSVVTERMRIGHNGVFTLPTMNSTGQDRLLTISPAGVVSTSGIVPSTVGTVTSVGLSMPTGFSISGSPVTTNGTIAVTSTLTNGLPVYATASGFTTTAPSTGVQGFWTRTGTNLHNTTLTDNVGIGTTTPTLGTLQIEESASIGAIAGLRVNESGVGQAVTISEADNGSALLITAADNGPAINSSVSGAVTQSAIGYRFHDTRISGTANINKTGVDINSTGTWNGTPAVNTGLNVNVSGGTTNYAALFNGGNVGIGTTAPGQRLTIEGTAPVAEIRTGGYLMLRPTSNTWDMRLQAVGTRLDVLSGGSLGSPIASFLNGGHVGISTTAPAGKLHVVTASSDGDVGDWGAGQLVVGQNGSQAGGVGISYSTSNNTGYISSLSPTVAWRDLGLRFRTLRAYTNGGTERLTIDAGGNYRLALQADNNLVYYTAGNCPVWASGTSCSDIRKKDRIVPLESMLPTIQQLSTIRFHYKEELKLDDDEHIGVIAQEIEKFFPDMVYYDKENDSYVVYYDKLTTVLIKGMQEQQEIIEALQEANTSVNEKLKNYASLVSDIELLKEAVGVDKRAQK